MLVDMCLGYVNSVLSPKAKVYRELRLDVLDQFGTVDLVGVLGNHADLIDYKMGRVRVEEADTNAQGAGYVLGLWDKWSEIETITVHFLMPRRDEVTYHTFSRTADYDRIKLRIATIIARSKAARAGLLSEHTPSPGTCLYCGSKGVCKALASKALAVSHKLQGDLVLPEKIELDPSNPTQVAMLLTLAPIMEDWAKQIRSDATRLSLEDGLDIPGYRRFSKSTPRKIVSVLGAWDALKAVMTIEDFLAACTNMSVVTLEETFAAKAKRGEKKATRQQLENLLRDADLLKDEGEVHYLRAVTQ